MFSKYERGYRFTSKRIRWWSNKFTVAENPECNLVQSPLKSHPLWVTLYIDLNEKWWQTSNPSLRDISPSELIILYISRNVLIPILGLLFRKIFIFKLFFRWSKIEKKKMATGFLLRVYEKKVVCMCVCIERVEIPLNM